MKKYVFILSCLIVPNIYGMDSKRQQEKKTRLNQRKNKLRYERAKLKNSLNKLVKYYLKNEKRLLATLKNAEKLAQQIDEEKEIFTRDKYEILAQVEEMSDRYLLRGKFVADPGARSFKRKKEVRELKKCLNQLDEGPYYGGISEGIIWGSSGDIGDINEMYTQEVDVKVDREYGHYKDAFMVKRMHAGEKYYDDWLQTYGHKGYCLHPIKRSLKWYRFEKGGRKGASTGITYAGVVTLNYPGIHSNPYIHDCLEHSFKSSSNSRSCQSAVQHEKARIERLYQSKRGLSWKQEPSLREVQDRLKSFDMEEEKIDKELEELNKEMRNE